MMHASRPTAIWSAVAPGTEKQVLLPFRINAKTLTRLGNTRLIGFPIPKKQGDVMGPIDAPATDRAPKMLNG
jgi:hypothetical protein